MEMIVERSQIRALRSKPFLARQGCVYEKVALVQFQWQRSFWQRSGATGGLSFAHLWELV